jgi:predicted metal-binding membrane protein
VRGRLLALTVVVAVIALAGYGGYVAYPRFDLPPVEGAAVLALAGAGGVAALFSPCSFPLLVTLLGRARQRREHRAASVAALGVGAGAFLVLVGVAIALGGRALIAEVTFDSPAGIAVRGVVGAVLLLLGHGLFGFGYVLAGFG